MHKLTIDPVTLDYWRHLEGVSRASRATRFSPLDLSRTALVVVDLQNVFTVPGQPMYFAATEGILPNVNRLAGVVRGHGGKIVWVRQTFSTEPRFALPDWRRKSFPNFQRGLEQSVAAGSYGYQLNDALDVQPTDLFVDKTRWGAMMPNSSRLHEVLQSHGIDTFIAAGCATDACVETTTREAAMLDYKTILIIDATATDSDEKHNATLANLNHLVLIDLLTTQQLLDEIGAAAQAAA